MSSFLAIWAVFMALWEGLIGENAQLAARCAGIRQRFVDETDGQLLIRAFVRLAVAIIVAPIAIVALGIIWNKSILVALIAFFWMIVTTILFVAAAPLGILIDDILSKKDTGKKYVTAAAWIIFTETLFSLAFLVMPVGNNIPWLLIAMVAVIAYVLSRRLGLRHSVINGALVIILLVAVIMFYAPSISRSIPATASALQGSMPKLDKQLANAINDSVKQQPAQEQEIVVELQPGQLLSTAAIVCNGSKHMMIATNPFVVMSSYGEFPRPSGVSTIDSYGDGNIWLKGGDQPSTVKIRRIR